MKEEPLIKVLKGGDDFKMIDCEVISGDRPALETEAKNTQLIRTGLSQTGKKFANPSKESGFSMNNPFVYVPIAVVLIVLVAILNEPIKP